MTRVQLFFHIHGQGWTETYFFPPWNQQDIAENLNGFMVKRSKLFGGGVVCFRQSVNRLDTAIVSQVFRRQWRQDATDQIAGSVREVGQADHINISVNIPFRSDVAKNSFIRVGGLPDAWIDRENFASESHVIPPFDSVVQEFRALLQNDTFRLHFRKRQRLALHRQRPVPAIELNADGNIVVGAVDLEGLRVGQKVYVKGLKGKGWSGLRGIKKIIALPEDGGVVVNGGVTTNRGVPDYDGAATLSVVEYRFSPASPSQNPPWVTFKKRGKIPLGARKKRRDY